MNATMQMGLVVSLLDRLSGPMQKVVQSVKGFNKAADLGKKMGEWGAKSQAFGALWGGIGAQMRQSASDFLRPGYELEESLAAVRTVAPATFGSIQADIEAVTASAKAWSGAHTDAATDYVRANYLMISSGLNTKAALAGTEVALTVAKGAMGDAMTTANALTTIYANMGDKTRNVKDEMGRLGDIMVKTQAVFKFPNLNQLTDGLKFAIPTAKMFRIDLAQLNAVMGAFNEAGFEGGMAGTIFAATMRNMNKASRSLGFELAHTANGGLDVIRTAENIRKKFSNRMNLPEVQQAFQDAFGDEGLRGITTLMDMTGRMTDAQGELVNSTGAAAKAQATMEGTPLSAWKRLNNQVDSLKTTIGTALAPLIEGLIPRIEAAIDWFKGFAEANPGLMELAGSVFGITMAILTILGPIAIVGGTVAQVVGGAIQAFTGLGKAILWVGAKMFFLNGELAVTPIGWIIIAVAGLITLLILAITYWDEIAASARAAAAWCVDVWNRAATWLKDIWSKVRSVIQENLFSVWGIAVMVGAAMFLAFYAPLLGMYVIGALIIGFWSEIETFFVNLWANVVRIFWVAIAAIGGGISTIWDSVVGVFARVIGFFASLPSVFYQAGAALFGAFIDGVVSMAGSFVSTVGDVLGAVRDFLPFSDAKNGPLSNLTASGQAFVTTFGEGMQAGAADTPAIMERFGQQLAMSGGEAASSGTGDRAPTFRWPSQQPSRQVVIHGLTINVQAADVAEAESFTGMIQGLAEGYA